MESREALVSWLDDAHSMENTLVPILENHAKDAKEHPEARDRIQRHAEETKRHAQLLADCLQELGKKPSSTKKAVSKMMGMGQAITTGPFEDELIKNAISDYATENFEIACYEALITAAQDLGEPKVEQICKQILEDERAMAQWLETQLPKTVHEFIVQARA